MLLNYKITNPEAPVPVFFLHGLLGNAENWGTIVKKLDRSAPGKFRIITVDLRNHGESFHSDEMSYPLMAADLIELADHLGLQEFHIVGHSMGGKMAMETALANPARVKSVIVVDIAPVQYKSEYSIYINALRDLDLSGVKKRSDAGKLIEEIVPDRALRMFFLTNLKKDGEGYKWRINLKGITSHYSNIWEPVKGGRVYSGPALFIRGGASDYVKDEYIPLIMQLFPAAELKTLEGAGHWVHSEKPDEFTELVSSFLTS